MATTIHHPGLERQATCGDGFARALVETAGWRYGPLPEQPPAGAGPPPGPLSRFTGARSGDSEPPTDDD